KATGKQYAAKFLRKRRKGADCRMDIFNEIAVLELAKANPYPQNILLTSARPLGDIRIVDFGLSRTMDKITEVREILGTPEYVGEFWFQLLNSQIRMHLFSFERLKFIANWVCVSLLAPEILNYEPISTATDMW
ncbi:hypothetical protein XENOCAPTIV_029294, partial [Xenoophorus captivus]